MDELQARFDSLSARQREVMELAITGLSSKEIGRKLNISPKTVENHRAWVMWSASVPAISPISSARR